MMSSLRVLAALGVCAVATAACSDPAPSAQGKPAPPAAPGAPAPVAPPATTVAVEPPLIDAPPAPASVSPAAQAIDASAFTADATDAGQKKQAMIRDQVLLDRAHFSPGVIDGRDGGNMRLAVKAFQQARGVAGDGQLNAETWTALTQDAAPAMTDYVITPQDVAGPFMPVLPPEDYEAMAKLPAMGFHTPLEGLAEKFHADEALLTALNPGVDFGVAGTSIVVPAVGPDTLPGKVGRIEIDKARSELRAFDDQGKLLAVYPATVGSTERPAPAGEWAVRTVAPRPTYTYDPTRLTFGKPTGKLTIAAGPNNPVGVAWIDLTKDTYGIHGTPEPRVVGKRASHGCVRLTNWDALELAAAVKKGAAVAFVGAETRAR
jgi:lipoprotein-anchoring transpeptidase ErfK/SrfK